MSKHSLQVSVSGARAGYCFADIAEIRFTSRQPFQGLGQHVIGASLNDNFDVVVSNPATVAMKGPSVIARESDLYPQVGVLCMLVVRLSVILHQQSRLSSGNFRDTTV